MKVPLLPSSVDGSPWKAFPKLPLSVKIVHLAIITVLAISFHLYSRIIHNTRPGATARGDFNWYTLEPSAEINWTPCYSGHKCARLSLPLDYSSSSLKGPETIIALRMIPASNTDEYKGTILVNPGGPGGSGTEFIGRAGTNLSHIVGGSFDILGFDPRGTGASVPLASCFDSESQRYMVYEQVWSRFINLTDGTLPDVKARRKLLGELCQDKIGGELGIGRFMSTPNVALDMLNIVKKLGQKKLQYWGFSYDSILGQYFAAMYPGKIGRLVIDGVYDAHNYRATLWNSNLIDTEKVVDSLFSFCHKAGADKCPLYESSAQAIEDRFYHVLSQVEQDPIPLASAVPPVTITKKNLQDLLFFALYKPTALFELVADTIAAIGSSNKTALTELVPKIVDPLECKCELPKPWFTRTEAFDSVACGDGDHRSFDRDEYAKYFSDLLALSPSAAPMWGIYYLGCTQWRIRPKWRYTGPLEANTSHPLLIVQPKYDPVCPLHDAKAVQARYGGAGLLVQDSYGHCSLSAPSLCTAKHVRAYFENGTLPEEGTVCDVDVLPFIGNVTDVSALSTEDAGLLEALRGLADQVPVFGSS